MVNNVTLLGRLVGSPLIKQTAQQVPIVKFTLLTSESWKDKSSNEVKTRSERHRIVCWDKIAAAVKDKLVDNCLVYVEGKIRSRASQNDPKVPITEIIATYVKILKNNQQINENAKIIKLKEETDDN